MKNPTEKRTKGRTGEAGLVAPGLAEDYCSHTP